MSDSGSGEDAAEHDEEQEADEPTETPEADEPDEEPDAEESNEEPDAEEPNEEPDDAISEAERAPLSDLRARVEAEEGQFGADVDVESEAPLSDLARETQATREEEDSGLFDEVDVGDIDAEAIWDAVVEEGEPPEELLGDATEAEPVTEPSASVDEHVINKREYCQRCEYFSEPPAVSCENDGTEILEMPDNDSFRVRDCPKVKESDEELSSVVEE